MKKFGFQLRLSSKKHRVSGLTHVDDFVLTGPTKKLMESERKMMSVHPIKAAIIVHRSPKSMKTLNRGYTGESEESCNNTDTLTCL